MKVTCGVDIIEINRIKESIEDLGGNKFVERVFTEQEINYCESKKAQKYQHYAARFAAKEAAFKAVSCFLNDKYLVTWKQFEVLSNDDGRPCVYFRNIEGLPEFESVDLSISHCKNYAVANVVVMSK
jgi:holo-[acyl-carrier protein] synthase